jgi:hypothetical protein
VDAWPAHLPLDPERLRLCFWFSHLGSLEEFP